MMERTYNLLRERWMPARRRDGQVEWIAPWQLTEGLEENPLCDFASPRPDIDAALRQFAIGLVQTTLAPEDDESWFDWLLDAPSPQELEAAFSTVEDAFWLDGDGPRFMQEYGGLDTSSSSITDLYLNAPGDNTRTQNRDFFVKRSEEYMSPAAVAAALFALQINASGGGPGYRTTIRGGGPLTTFLLGETLWDSIWLHILNASKFAEDEDSLELIFPWLTRTRTSKGKSGRATVRGEDAHWLQLYWPMPWRIWLDAPERGAPVEDTPCALYGTTEGKPEEHAARYATFQKTNYGVNYLGLWEHPLTPYRVKKKRDGTVELISLKGSSRTVRYSNWPNLALMSPRSSSSGDVVAEALRVLIADRLSGRTQRRRAEQLPWLERGNLRMLACGYEMDNAKALQWHEAELPVLLVPDEYALQLRAFAEELIGAAESFADLLYDALRRMLEGKVTGKNKKGYFTWELGSSAERGTTVIDAALEQFWRQTTEAFYTHLREGRALILEEDHPGLQERKESWLEVLRKAVLARFEAHAPSDIARAEDIRAVTCARSELRGRTHARKLRKKMNLPPRADT